MQETSTEKMAETQAKAKIAVFYCCRIPGSSDEERQQIEKRWESAVKCFPLPCSGRLEQKQLLMSLEAGNDAAYVITCPEEECRYFEGSRRAAKRVQHARALVSEIGIEPDRLGVLVASEGSGTLGEYVEQLEQKATALGPLFVHVE